MIEKKLPVNMNQSFYNSMGIRMLTKLSRLTQTAWHLKATQFWYMGLYRVLPQRYRSLHIPFEDKLVLRKNIRCRIKFVPPIPYYDNIVSDTGEFTFLHKTVHMNWPPDWEKANKEERLWCYNLHYHDYIWGLSFEKAKILVESWIDSCSFRQGAASWRPYPISVRLCNWLKYFFCTNAKRCQTEFDFTEKLIKSVATQAGWLLKNIELHLLGNHLFENAVALYLVGACFDGSLAETCTERGLDLLKHELDEQILSDGGHFERSPMYHCRFLYLLADLYNFGIDNMIPQIEDCLVRMWSWLQLMCHPDGQTALFNDSAHNIYLSPVALSEYLSRLLDRASPHPLGAFGLSDSGYFGWIVSDDEYIVCDAGPVGPDYQPGHAHSDIFSFELSLNGRRMIVDSGTSTYSSGPERQYLRSTAAHNTVEINGRNQVDVWGSFRVGRRVKPQDVRFTPSLDGFELSAWHDGYKHNSGLRHRRTFAYRKKHNLRITDEFQGIANQNIRTRLHFAPDCIIKIADSCCVIKNGSVSLQITFDGYTSPHIEKTHVSFDLGGSVNAQCLILSLRDKETIGNIFVSW